LPTSKTGAPVCCFRPWRRWIGAAENAFSFSFLDTFPLPVLAHFCRRPFYNNPLAPRSRQDPYTDMIDQYAAPCAVGWL